MPNHKSKTHAAHTTEGILSLLKLDKKIDVIGMILNSINLSHTTHESSTYTVVVAYSVY